MNSYGHILGWHIYTLHLQSLLSQHLLSFSVCNFLAVEFCLWFLLLFIQNVIFYSPDKYTCVFMLCVHCVLDFRNRWEMNSFYSSHLRTLLFSACVRPSLVNFCYAVTRGVDFVLSGSRKLCSFAFFFFSSFIRTDSNMFRLCPRI